MPTPIPPGPRRIVTFNSMPFAYQGLAGWIRHHGHHHVAVVTSPGPAARRSDAYREIVAAAPHDQDVVVTTRVKRLEAHLEALEPDVILTYTFPFRLPSEILRIPRYGAINVHPTLLPAYRGPNPLRPLYDGAPVFGATVHWMDADFDTGPILAQHSSPVPADITPELVGRGMYLAASGVIGAGLAAAWRGDTGTPQDEAQASYAAPFSLDDEELDWDFPAQLYVRRVVALQMLGHPVFGVIDGNREQIGHAVVVMGGVQRPGTIVAQIGATYQIAVRDGVVAVTTVASTVEA